MGTVIVWKVTALAFLKNESGLHISCSQPTSSNLETVAEREKIQEMWSQKFFKVEKKGGKVFFLQKIWMWLCNDERDMERDSWRKKSGETMR